MHINKLSEFHCNDLQLKSDHFVINVRHYNTGMYTNGSDIIIAKCTTTTSHMAFY